VTIIESRVPADERRDRRLMLRLEQMSNAFYDGNPFDLFPDFDDQIAAAIGGGGSSFETVAKNLSAEGAVLAYNGAGDLASITYANGAIKTLNYTGDKLTSIVLSGTLPPGIDTVKTLSYTGDDLTDITYS
jgi:hypothetical protein